MPSADSPTKEKKHRSKEEKKKRKRDGDDEVVVKHTSKKHRSEKAATDDTPIVLEDASPDYPAESPFHLQTSTLYLPLAPVSQKFPLEGICAEHLSPLLSTYYPPLHGVVLSYSNVRISQTPYGDDGPSALLKSVDEYAVSWAWVTADFLVFKPQRGAELEGYINLQSDGHLGVVCWNLFNASIERSRLPKSWKWVDESEVSAEDEDAVFNNYVDGEGKKVEGKVKFKIVDMECSHDRTRGFLSIAGTMLSDEEENVLLHEEAERASTEKRIPGRRLGGARAIGATSLAVQQPEPEAEGSKKRRRD